MGTAVADSLVDPPGSRLRLASVRSNNLPQVINSGIQISRLQVNFTEKFTLLAEETGRFRLVSAVPLSLPAYPSAVTETLLYVTVICNGRPFPLMTIRLNAANTIAPSFLNEPYVAEVGEAGPPLCPRHPPVSANPSGTRGRHADFCRRLGSFLDLRRQTGTGGSSLSPVMIRVPSRTIPPSSWPPIPGGHQRGSKTSAPGPRPSTLPSSPSDESDPSPTPSTSS